MEFMRVFWIIMGAIWIITLITYITKRKIPDKINDVNMILLMIAFPFLVVAMATKDPVFSGIGLPSGYEWIGGLITTVFVGWLFYLTPLKNRVTILEVNMGRMEERITAMDKNMERMDKNMDRLNRNIDWIKSNCVVKARV